MAQAVPIPDRIARARSWLRREPTRDPLVGLLWEPDIPPLPEFLALLEPGALVTPEQIDPAFFFPYIDDYYTRATAFPGDIVPAFTPAFGIPWVEAIAGCAVVAEPGSLWAQPFLKDYAGRPPIRFDPANPWLRTLVEFTRAMVAFASGRFPVALPQMRGPLDTLAAMRTPQQMGLDLIEQTGEVQRILAELTGLWIGIAKTVLAEIPPYHGGYSSRMKMWAPGPTITPQNDISTLLSPGMYRRVISRYDEQIMTAFPYHCFHMHGSELHQVENILALDRLTAIQFTLEHTLGGPSLERTLPVLRRILGRKPLLLAALDVASAEHCLAELPASGLCLTLAASGPDIPDEFVEWVERHHEEAGFNRAPA